MKLKMMTGLAVVAMMVMADVGFGQSGITREQIQGWTNIFSRTRAANREGTGPRVTGAAPVFIGVIKQDDGYVGFLQMTGGRGGIEVVSVRAGDVIAWDQSRVSQVGWATLVLEGGSRAQGVVELGHDLLNDSKIPPPGPVIGSLDAPGAGTMPGVNVPGGRARPGGAARMRGR